MKEKEERITYEEFMVMFRNAPKFAYMLYDKAEDEIERLNNIINKTRRILGNYVHYSIPDEQQNAKNEAIVDEAYNQLHSNLKELKEKSANND